MSEDVLSVIPTDPLWQPERSAGERLAAVLAELAFGLPSEADVEIDITWHDVVTAVDCGANLERIGCPLCGDSIDAGWWEDLLESHADDGFATLAVDAPCCGGATSLDALLYDWPCGFARFEAAVWNPERTWFGDEELALLGSLLGHPVKQVRAHI
ncbi:hypothetical protein [Actinacidiphila yeochonensis]|uniref:hypothetical protein n=1 Tax=Actinacidiphila yeochonensis TaxID=89050 RepID=UPI000560688D|nr:hypothetical protein [Actinacidiphila yeochonensis]